MSKIETITAKIWWDDLDSDNSGWAYTCWINGVFYDSGPLDNVSDDASDEELIRALRAILTSEANEKLTDDNITIE